MRKPLTLPTLTNSSGGPIFDFDLETRRIGFHYGGKGKPDGCEPVIVAGGFDGEPVTCRGLQQLWSERDAREMLEWFVERYNASRMVTGHYIRKFDLPILNGALMEWGYKPLTPKLTLDTKLDLKNVGGLSQSQENLGSLKKLEESKFHMNDNWWRKVARLTPEGLALAETRVLADVEQHRAIRVVLESWFRAPSMWSP